MISTNDNEHIIKSLIHANLLRSQANLSQEQLASEIGVAVSTIRRWEKGEAEPTMTVSQMKKFCRAVKQNFEELPESLILKHPQKTRKRFNSACH